jgi:hypothetical protein
MDRSRLSQRVRKRTQPRRSVPNNQVAGAAWNEQALSDFILRRLGSNRQRLGRLSATRRKCNAWWAREDSNLQPSGYERANLADKPSDFEPFGVCSLTNVRVWLRRVIGHLLVGRGSPLAEVCPVATTVTHTCWVRRCAQLVRRCCTP